MRRFMALAAVVVALACGEPPVVAPARAPPAPTAADRDGDGLDDELEARLARDHLPYLSDDPADRCALSGIVYRVRPHPVDPAFVAIVYVRLYAEDCGIHGHVGDDEVFGVSVDPGAPGVVAMVAIGHQDTLCEQVSACGRCPGQRACTTAELHGQAVPVVFASRDKHAHYALADRCTWTACLDRCALAPTPSVPPLVNAGEPGHPLLTDLTEQAFVTQAAGWTHAALLHVDPWDRSRKFGDSANSGTIASRLVDDAFVAPTCPARP